ncbi:tropomyosin-1 [Procambarus clarkii]|uniref:tropomyosin-1 n=1 Tax=Procambarus clarkii TaxID=6728 RepID=UPI001E6737C4|nr:chromosome partition protein Smc-like [Procambarus clarkii]
MESKQMCMQDSVMKLRLEAQKVDEQLTAAEAKAAQSTKQLQEANKRYNHLLEEQDLIESRTRSTRNNLRKCHESFLIERERINNANTRLAELQHKKTIVKDDIARLEVVAKVVERRMNAWEEILKTRRMRNTPEEEQVIQARQSVASLREHRDSLKGMVGKLPRLRDQVDSLTQRKDHLEKRASMQHESLKEVQDELHRANQDVRVYQRRDNDHVRRLQNDRDQVSARNARLAMELSQMEENVTKIRDRLEAGWRPH